MLDCKHTIFNPCSKFPCVQRCSVEVCDCICLCVTVETTKPVTEHGSAVEMPAFVPMNAHEYDAMLTDIRDGPIPQLDIDVGGMRIPSYKELIRSQRKCT